MTGQYCKTILLYLTGASVWVAIAQSISLCMPSFDTPFESQSHHQRIFYDLIDATICLWIVTMNRKMKINAIWPNVLTDVYVNYD